MNQKGLKSFIKIGILLCYEYSIIGSGMVIGANNYTTHLYLVNKIVI